MKMQVAVSRKDNVVRVDITLRDAYEAAVALDDMCERLASGEGLVLSFEGSSFAYKVPNR